MVISIIHIFSERSFHSFIRRFAEHSACNFVSYLVNVAKDNYLKTPWDKKYGKVVWRGSNWMPYKFELNKPLSHYPRYYVSMLSSNNSDWLDACITDIDAEYFPVRVYWNYTSCVHRNLSRMDVGDMMKYKYILTMGGTSGTSSSILWKMASSSVVLYVKSEFIDWYDPYLVPWKHYVPIASDFSDLEEKFRMLELHPQLPLGIIKNANEIAELINIYSFKKLEFIQTLLKHRLIKHMQY